MVRMPRETKEKLDGVAVKQQTSTATIIRQAVLRTIAESEAND